jgi:zinc resistance-associated protein
MRTSQFHAAGAALALAVLLVLPSPAAARSEADEREAVQKLNEEFHAKTNADRRQLFSKQSELDAQIYSASPDDKKIRTLTEEIAALRAKLFEASVELRRQLVKEGAPADRQGWGYGHEPGHGGRGYYGHGYGHGGRGYGPCGPGAGRHW